MYIYSYIKGSRTSPGMKRPLTDLQPRALAICRSATYFGAGVPLIGTKVLSSLVAVLIHFSTGRECHVLLQIV